jgi:hypothetical protein
MATRDIPKGLDWNTFRTWYSENVGQANIAAVAAEYRVYQDSQPNTNRGRSRTPPKSPRSRSLSRSRTPPKQRSPTVGDIRRKEVEEYGLFGQLPKDVRNIVYEKRGVAHRLQGLNKSLTNNAVDTIKKKCDLDIGYKEYCRYLDDLNEIVIRIKGTWAANAVRKLWAANFVASNKLSIKHRGKVEILIGIYPNIENGMLTGNVRATEFSLMFDATLNDVGGLRIEPFLAHTRNLELYANKDRNPDDSKYRGEASDFAVSYEKPKKLAIPLETLKTNIRAYFDIGIELILPIPILLYLFEKRAICAKKDDKYGSQSYTTTQTQKVVRNQLDRLLSLIDTDIPHMVGVKFAKDTMTPLYDSEGNFIPVDESFRDIDEDLYADDEDFGALVDQFEGRNDTKTGRKLLALLPAKNTNELYRYIGVMKAIEYYFYISQIEVADISIRTYLSNSKHNIERDLKTFADFCVNIKHRLKGITIQPNVKIFDGIEYWRTYMWKVD